LPPQEVSVARPPSGKLRFRVTWWQSANFTFTCHRPFATPASMSSGAVRSCSKVVGPGRLSNYACSGGGEFACRSHRQFQYFAERLQVFRAGPGPAHLREVIAQSASRSEAESVHTKGSNTDLRSNIGDGQTAARRAFSTTLNRFIIIRALL
jgi:hypothetical protein